MTKNTNNKESLLNLRGDVFVCLFLAITVIAVYWQVRDCGFVNFDDTIYVSENTHVQSGISLEGIKWAFGFTDRGYWHPLTWLSHMLDCQLYGLKPGRHHLTNVFFHIASSLLLFLAFRRMTGALWKSAFVAALFALHPMNVDSVAWVSERKNVLSSFFWMLTMFAYACYSERPSVRRYMAVLSIFAIGLLSKPMLVTLPFVFILMDYWPLKRLRFVRSGSEGTGAFNVVMEKAPFFLLSLVTIFVSSISVERRGGLGLLSTQAVPMMLRIENALVSYVGYIGKMIWPERLAVFYPFPPSIPSWEVVGSGLLLIIISTLVFRSTRNRPYLVIGWLWYLGTLLPVSGLMQGGLWPAMADRWGYVPLIGLFIMLGWGIPDLVSRWRYREAGLATMVAVLFFMLMAATWAQVGYWRSSITLFEHAIDVTSNNAMAHYNLGVALTDKGKTTEALRHYSETLRINPNFIDAYINRGVALAKQGKVKEAIREYTKALSLNPGSDMAHNNLGNALERQGKMAEAISHYYEALRINPDYIDARNNLGVALAKQGRIDEAVRQFDEALRIAPGCVEAYVNLGNALFGSGNLDGAITNYGKALRLRPNYAEVHNYLGVALIRKGKIREAVTHFREAVRLRPGYVSARNNLRKALRAWRIN